MKKTEMIRADPDFKKGLDEIKIKRIKEELDTKMQSDRRLTEAIRRHSLWEKIKKDITFAPLNKKGKMGKKGFIVELILLMAIGLVALVFFAGWKYGINLVNENLLAIPSTEDNATNISGFASETFSPMNEGLNGLKLMGFIMIFAFTISTFIIAYFSRDHPILFLAYVLVTILLVIFSIYISNEYQKLLQDETIGTILQTYSVSSWIMSNLPLWIGLVGLIGIVIMVLGIVNERNIGI